MTAVARDTAGALAFLRSLERRPEFTDVYPHLLTEIDGGSELRYTMRYRPREPEPEAEAAEAPAPQTPPGEPS